MALSLPSRRLTLILSRLQERGEVRTTALAEDFDVSEMTIRRDLSLLVQRVLVHRVHGGAVLEGRELGYEERSKRRHTAKQAVGIRAAALVRAGQTLFLDSGSTAMEVARALILRTRSSSFEVRVVTHATNIATALATCPSLRVHQIGGEIYQNMFSAVGPEALEQLRALKFDICFLGVNGATVSEGWTNSNQVEVAIKQVVIKRSRAPYVIADSSKWGYAAFAHIAPLGDMNGWITDALLPKSGEEELRGLGVEVVRASKES